VAAAKFDALRRGSYHTVAMRKPHPKRPKALGVDIGRVIIDGSSHPDGGDTAFFRGDDAAMLATPEMTGAIESISRLAERFEGRVWLVSKCGPVIQDRSMRWLANQNFFERTGIPATGPRPRLCRAGRRLDRR